MKYHVTGKQYSYGEAIGIMLIENYAPYIPGDVANATSYDFPVRFAELPGITPDRLFAHDTSLVNVVIDAAKNLRDAGVRAITGDCGFLALFQETIATEVGLPVFLSSLLQLDFIGRIIDPGKSVGIVTANSESLTPTLLSRVTDLPAERMLISGLESKSHFVSAVFDEDGLLDSDIVEKEVLEAAVEMTERGDPAAILLECSLLPPYGKAVHDATGLPVFDYNTMITYVYNAVVKHRFHGNM